MELRRADIAAGGLPEQDDWGHPSRKAGDAEIVEYLPGWRIWDQFDASWRLPYGVLVTLTVTVVDRQPICRSVRVSHLDLYDWGETVEPRAGVDGTLLRSLPIARMLNDAIAAAVMKQDAPGKDNLFTSAAEFEAFRKSTQLPEPKGGGSSHPST